MAGMVGQEAVGKKPDGEGQWGKEGQMARKERMAGYMRARWQLLGVVGVAWSRSSICCSGRGQIRG